MKLDLQALLQLFAFIQQIAEKGQPAWDAVKKAAQANGVDADTALFDHVIIDAARQKALAEREAAGTDIAGTVATGSGGE